MVDATLQLFRPDKSPADIEHSWTQRVFFHGTPQARCLAPYFNIEFNLVQRTMSSKLVEVVSIRAYSCISKPGAFPMLSSALLNICNVLRWLQECPKVKNIKFQRHYIPIGPWIPGRSSAPSLHLYPYAASPPKKATPNQHVGGITSANAYGKTQ